MFSQCRALVSIDEVIAEYNTVYRISFSSTQRVKSLLLHAKTVDYTFYAPCGEK